MYHLNTLPLKGIQCLNSSVKRGQLLTIKINAKYVIRVLCGQHRFGRTRPNTRLPYEEAEVIAPAEEPGLRRVESTINTHSKGAC